MKFKSHHVLYEDNHIIAINKPPPRFTCLTEMKEFNLNKMHSHVVNKSLFTNRRMGNKGAGIKWRGIITLIDPKKRVKTRKQKFSGHPSTDKYRTQNLKKGAMDCCTVFH